MKKFILGIIVGGIIFGTCIYAATTYYYAANEVSYIPSDSTWNVTTVKAALDNLKSTSGTALTDLKNTSIAKAVSANGNSLSSVINTLGGISNKGDLTKTINPGGSVNIPAGYYSGGKITANANQNSGTYTVTSNGPIDMGANNTYRYINANVNSSMNHIYDSTSDGATTKSWTATTKSFVIASGATLGTNWSSSNELNSLAAQISSNLPLCATLKNTRPNNGTHAYACKVFCGVVNAGTTVTVTSKPYGYGATSVSIEAYAL